MKKIIALVLCLFVVIYSHGQPGVPYVILVSFDGFRYDYLDRFELPHFRQFAAEGTRATSLIPAFPSKTFPNHYTIVTGMYPGNHGLVDNSFYDPDRHERYGMHLPERVRDPNYYGGVPLWELAKQHQLKSASYFWVGTEIPGRHPDYFYRYDESVADTARVDQVIAWMKFPEPERPHFITLYFSSPDHESHLYGPLSRESEAAAMNADRLLGRLMRGIERINLPVNIILVSDHGMSDLKQRSGSYIFLDEILNLNSTAITVVNSGTQAHIYTRNEQSRDSLYAILKDQSKTFSVLKQSAYPEHWHYRNKRSGDLLITAHEGYYIREAARAKFLSALDTTGVIGVHGYDPARVKDMHGIFLAKGPNIAKGELIPPFENIHIYPLIAKILQLTLPVVDGKEQVLGKIYRKGR